MDTELNAGRSNPFTQQFPLHNLKLAIEIQYLEKDHMFVLRRSDG
jgi:hypothetical protein